MDINNFAKKLIDQNELNKIELISLLDKMDQTVFSTKPSVDNWSIEEHISHLIATWNAYKPNIEEVLKNSNENEIKLDYKPRFLMRKFIGMMEPPVKRKVKTFKPFLPKESVSLDEIKEKIEVYFSELDGMIKEIVKKGSFKTKIQSPASKFIKFQLGEGLYLLTVHDKHHIWIAEKMKEGEY